MSIEQPRGPRSNEPKTAHDALKELTAVPVEALTRALRHDLDSPTPIFLSEEDSKIAIAHAIREAMETREMSVYRLHEKTGLPCDVIEGLRNGTGDISDSEPLQRLEDALGVPLSHL